MEVRVRYAPSPTGLQHIGGIRTALFNYFFARSQKGKFILRIEDTDQERSSEEALQDLYDTLSWLNITPDEGPIQQGPYAPYVQSERADIYRNHAYDLIQKEKAYKCFCTSERLDALREEQVANKSKQIGYDGKCRHLSEEEIKENESKGMPFVIRLKVPKEGKTTFHDVLMGDITRKNKDVNPDPVLLKSDGFPTYHLANVIDDHSMNITHIMRAQEWIPSGPLHILIYEAFGWTPPLYCHLPMVMGKDGKKLSKRHGSTAVRDFKEKGYLPEALLNYVSMVGWSYDDKTQFFSMDELCTLFSLEKINKAPGVFDYKKLDWYNGMYIREKSDDELFTLLLPFMWECGYISKEVRDDEKEKFLSIIPLIKERLKLLSDVGELVKFLYTDDEVKDSSLLIPKKQTLLETYQALKGAHQILVDHQSESDEIIEEHLSLLASTLGIKVNGVFMPIRVSVTTSPVSPPLFDSIRALGWDTSLKRIERAITLLETEVKNG